MYSVQTDKSETDLNHVTGTVLNSRDTELNPQGGYCLQGQEMEGGEPKAAEQDRTYCARQRSVKVQPSERLTAAGRGKVMGMTWEVA